MVSGANNPPSRRILFLALALGLLTSPLRAADVDFFVPADTAILNTVNFKQIFSSPLFKKHANDPLRQALKDNNDIKTVLDDLGFDPFLDLDRLIAASPGTKDKDKGIVIVHGRFNLDKFKAKAEEAAKDNADILKIHKIGDDKGGKALLYEVNFPELSTPIFVTLPNATTLLASPGKDVLVDAVRQKDKPKLKNADFQKLLESMDSRQSWSMAALSSAIPNDNPFVKQIIANLDAVGGGILIEDDIVIELAGSTQTAKQAQDQAKKINNLLNLGLGLVASIASNEKRLEPFADVLKTVKAKAKDKTVLLKVTITAELIEKALMDKEKP